MIGAKRKQHGWLSPHSWLYVFSVVDQDFLWVDSRAARCCLPWLAMQGRAPGSHQHLPEEGFRSWV